MKIICVDDEKLILDMTVEVCLSLPRKPEVCAFQTAEKALEYFHEHSADIALLDINLPDMNGITLAKKINELSPDTAIIFLTGYPEYALDAIAMHASGYLLKPVSEEKLKEEIEYAYEIIGLKKAARGKRNIAVRTFGTFHVLVNGEPVRFTRSRSKELLAYLVDRHGSFVSRAAAFSVLYENRPYDRRMQKQFDVILRSLRQTLDEYGAGGILEMSKGSIRVVPELFDCDLYRFFEGDAQTVNSYRGEYMSEYAWASFTEAGMA